jgi:hypothetical protein
MPQHIDCIKKQDACHVKKDEISIDDIIKEWYLILLNRLILFDIDASIFYSYL